MGSTGNGVKAGVIAGLIYGILLGVLSYFTVASDKTNVIATISNSLPANSPFTAEQLYGIVLLITPAITAVGGVIGGIIVGALYGKLFERIPGGTSMVRGIFVGLILWVILSVLGGLGNLRYGLLVYLGDAAIGVGGALLFGFLLGYLYARFTRSPVMDPAMKGL